MKLFGLGHQVGGVRRLNGHHQSARTKAGREKEGKEKMTHLLLALFIVNLGMLILGRLCEAKAESIAVRCFLISMTVLMGWFAGKKDSSDEKGATTIAGRVRSSRLSLWAWVKTKKIWNVDSTMLAIVYVEGGEVIQVAATDKKLVRMIIVDLDRQQAKERWAEWSYIYPLPESVKQEAMDEANRTRTQIDEAES